VSLQLDVQTPHLTGPGPLHHCIFALRLVPESSCHLVFISFEEKRERKDAVANAVKDGAQKSIEMAI
jgi:hypothetical protein